MQPVREKPHIFEDLHSALADSTAPSDLQVADFKILWILKFHESVNTCFDSFEEKFKAFDTVAERGTQKEQQNRKKGFSKFINLRIKYIIFCPG